MDFAQPAIVYLFAVGSAGRAGPGFKFKFLGLLGRAEAGHTGRLLVQRDVPRQRLLVGARPPPAAPAAASARRADAGPAQPGGVTVADGDFELKARVGGPG